MSLQTLPQRGHLARLLDPACSRACLTTPHRLIRTHPHPATVSTTRRRLHVTNAASVANASLSDFHAVPHRALVSVHGPQTVKLLQGLLTCNVAPSAFAIPDQATSSHTSQAITDAQPPTLLYGALLQPSGRMLAPVFLHPHPQRDQLSRETDQQALVLDVDERNVEQVMQHIKRFKLRSKVKFDADQLNRDWRVNAQWEGGQQETEGSSQMSAAGWHVAKDARTPQMGHRLLVQADHTAPTDTTPHAYTIHRYLQGVGEGPIEFVPGASLPLEVNLDWMGGVDYKKGCYVGQELTARTHHTGVVRKRVVPVSLYDPQLGPPSQHRHDASFEPGALTSGADVRSTGMISEGHTAPSRGRSAGRLLGNINNAGLALLRLEQVHRTFLPHDAQNALRMSVQTSEGRWLGVQPWIPAWWPEHAKSTDQAQT